MTERTPALRADGARNRERVLSAAERVFAERGLSASMVDIAQAAGVGVGTVYRGFTTKSQLIQELYEKRIDEFASRVRESDDHTRSAGDVLRALLRYLVDAQADDRGFDELLASATQNPVGEVQKRVKPVIDSLVARAKSEGAVRSDLASTDIPTIVTAAAGLARHGGDLGRRLARRHLELILTAIFSEPDLATVPPALSDIEYARWAGDSP